MYDGILHKPLQLPPGKSDALSSLLVGLLQKDQHRRLGAIADFVSSETQFWDGLVLKALNKPFPSLDKCIYQYDVLSFIYS